MIKRYRKNKLNGSVLYTVVAVMMIMTVFIFAALSLASAANRRAFNSYANNQTQYTARSVVETVWDQIENTPELAKQIDALGKKEKGSKLSFTVKLSDESMGEVVNDVEKMPTVTYLGKGTDYGYDIDDPFYKLSVTVELLGQENTLAGYFLPEKIENFAFDYALVSLDSAGSNNFGVYGPMCYGASSSSEGWNEMSNDGKLSTPINYNGDLSILHADNINIKPKTGIFINGNFKFGSGNLEPDINALKYYKDLTYIYITKMLDYNSTPTNIGTAGAPILLMAGSIKQNTSTEQFIYGDVYLYGTDTSVIGTNRIKQWNSDLIAKKDNAKPLNFKSYTGGNLYSLGTIDVDGSDGTYGTLANNVVANTLNFKMSSNTTGAVVADNVNISGGNSYSFANGLFSDKFICQENTYINNIKYNRVNKVVAEHDLTGDFSANYWNVGEDEHFIYYDMSSYFSEYKSDGSIQASSINIEINTPEMDNYGNLMPKIKKITIQGWINSSGVFFDKQYELNDYQAQISIPIKYTMNPYETLTLKIPQIEFEFPFTDLEDNGNLLNKVQVNNVYIKNCEYTIDESGNTEFLKDVNDVAFGDKNVIYIDDIDKSVKIEKYVDDYGYTKLKISKADLTGIDEGNEIGLSYTDIDEYYYDSQYSDFLSAVVDNITFPESMKKTNVLKSNGGFVDDSFLNIDSSTGKSEIESNAETEVANAFEHISETEGLVYNFDSSDLTYPLEVNSSCTFTGTLNSNEKIEIKPTSDKIYIKLIDFSMDINCKTENMITVYDNGGTKCVNFLIPKGQSVTIVGNVLTEYYINNINNIKILQNPIKDDVITGKKVVDQEKIPGIYFYMECDKDNMAELNFQHSKTSAYIIAPTGKLKSDGNDNSNSTYIYKFDEDDEDNKNTVSTNNAIIGAAIFKEVSVSANNRRFFYVNPNPKLPGDINEELHYKARCIYYQSY